MHQRRLRVGLYLEGLSRLLGEEKVLEVEFLPVLRRRASLREPARDGHILALCRCKLVPSYYCDRQKDSDSPGRRRESYVTRCQCIAGAARYPIAYPLLGMQCHRVRRDARRGDDCLQHGYL